jgi:hypothetical protein
MVGLSVSPIVQTIVGSVVALLVTLASGLAGIKPSGESPPAGEDSHAPAAKGGRILKRSLDPVPVSLFVIGLALGASLGTYARTNDWLGPDPARLVSRWKGSGLEDKEILQRAFNELYPLSSTPSEDKKEEKPSSTTTHQGVLFAVTADQKAMLLTAQGNILKQRLLLLKNKYIDSFVQSHPDSASLTALRDILCLPGD